MAYGWGGKSPCVGPPLLAPTFRDLVSHTFHLSIAHQIDIMEFIGREPNHVSKYHSSCVPCRHIHSLNKHRLMGTFTMEMRGMTESSREGISLLPIVLVTTFTSMPSKRSLERSPSSLMDTSIRPLLNVRGSVTLALLLLLPFECVTLTRNLSLASAIVTYSRGRAKVHVAF